MKEHRATVLLLLSAIVVSLRPVVPPGFHTAFFEISGQSRKDMDHSVPAFPSAPYYRAQRGKPHFTLLSDGKPLRRLLVGSYENSSFTAALLVDGLPVTSRK
jgi:hypothetical protein